MQGEEGGLWRRLQDLRLPTVLIASAGLFGVQVVWGLQNVSTSRIFQTLGADVADLPILWIAAPLTGLLVQPVVGHFSDCSRSRFGRRRPFIAIGALLTGIGMLMLGLAQTLVQAVAGLWILTASANVAMQPLRALLADLLPAERRAAGYAVQVVLIGTGAVLASALPWVLGHVFGVRASAELGSVPPTVRVAFVIGAALVVITALVSILAPDPPVDREHDGQIATANAPSPPRTQGIFFMIGGAAIIAIAFALRLRRETYLLALVVLFFGTAVEWLRRRQRSGRPVDGLLRLVGTISTMPAILRRLAVVQFFTWFGLFTLWVYAVPAVAAGEAGRTGKAVAGAASYNASADRVGLFFALFDAAAIAIALMLPLIVGRARLVHSHQWSLLFGAAGLAAFAAVGDAGWAWLGAIGVGAAWASILSAPYTLVANNVAPANVGTYLGIHNIFLVLPQLVAATTLGLAARTLQQASPTAMVWLAAIALLLAAASCQLLKPWANS
jgi:maltose/moltooligosaccharide transporter